MKRFKVRSLSAILPLLAMLALALPANAALWCKADPIVVLDGTTYQVVTAIPEENVPQVTGALAFTIHSAIGTVREVAFTDLGYNGHGETVAFKDSGYIDKHIFKLSVPSSGPSFPVQMEIYRDSAHVGTYYGMSRGMSVNVSR